MGDEHIGVIPEDGLLQDQKPSVDGKTRKRLNYDHPNAMDHSLLFQHLQALKRGSAVNYRYTVSEHTRMQEAVRVEPKNLFLKVFCY